MLCIMIVQYNDSEDPYYSILRPGVKLFHFYPLYSLYPWLYCIWLFVFIQYCPHSVRTVSNSQYKKWSGISLWKIKNWKEMATTATTLVLRNQNQLHQLTHTITRKQWNASQRRFTLYNCPQFLFGWTKYDLCYLPACTFQSFIGVYLRCPSLKTPRAISLSKVLWHK